MLAGYAFAIRHHSVTLGVKGSISENGLELQGSISEHSDALNASSDTDSSFHHIIPDASSSLQPLEVNSTINNSDAGHKVDVGEVERSADSGNTISTTGVVHAAPVGIPSSRSARLKQVAQTALLEIKEKLREVKAVLWYSKGDKEGGWLDFKFVVLAIICCVGICCIAGEQLFREQDRRKKDQLEARQAARGGNDEMEHSESLGGILERGKSQRGDSGGHYHFGDFSRGIVQAGKEGRGGEGGYRPGDFTRGLVHTLSHSHKH